MTLKSEILTYKLESFLVETFAPLPRDVPPGGPTVGSQGQGLLWHLDAELVQLLCVADWHPPLAQAVNETHEHSSCGSTSSS
jgi:hypothetical protein